MNNKVLHTILIAILTMLLSSCNYSGNLSGAHWMLAMHDMHAVEAQEEDHTTLSETKMDAAHTGMDQIESWGGAGSGVRAIPHGSIPRGVQPYPFGAGDFDLAAKELRNPLPKTISIMERGQKQFNIHCAVCHGYKADGQGTVSPRFTGIPDLNTDKIKAWQDGEIFHIITMGRARMKSFAAQIDVNDRWAVIHYLRLLQTVSEKSKAK